MEKKIKFTNKKLVYYGPHPCQRCDPDGSKGTKIVRAENNEVVFSYDFVHGSHYPNHVWKKHKCITN